MSAGAGTLEAAVAGPADGSDGVREQAQTTRDARIANVGRMRQRSSRYSVEASNGLGQEGCEVA